LGEELEARGVFWNTTTPLHREGNARASVSAVWVETRRSVDRPALIQRLAHLRSNAVSFDVPIQKVLNGPQNPISFLSSVGDDGLHAAALALRAFSAIL
jgi:hypothetical protein